MQSQLIGQANKSFRPSVYKRHAVSVLFMAADTGRFLTLKRADHKNFPQTWGTVGGKAKIGENFVQAALRETFEEAGFELNALYPISDNDGSFTHSMTFLALLPHEMTPALNDEHIAHQWMEFSDWPTPMYPPMQHIIHSDTVKSTLIHMTPEILRGVQIPVVSSKGALEPKLRAA